MILEQQREAIEHLRKWKVGALFMECGTGKTRTALELINDVDCDLILWIAPLRTIDNLKEEIEKWNFKRDICYVGVESIGMSDRIYLNILKLIEGKKVFCVCDESLKIKNFTAKRTRRVIEIGKLCEYRLCLNGTPMTRDLLDVWSQFEFLSPKILNMSLAQFKNTFCKYTTITKRFSGYKSYTKEFITGYENIDYLYSLIENYVYECQLHIDVNKHEKRVNYTIDDNAREDYNYLKSTYLDDEMLEYKNNNIFLEMTCKMQHSYSVTEDKFRCVEDLLNKIEGKTIIYCRFVDSREECEKRFPLALVLSFQKESFGLNLQDYNNIIYFDKIWDYALMNQSERRIYRTGQAKDCNYYYLDGNVGLESLINRNIAKKISISEYFKNISKKELKEIL